MPTAEVVIEEGDYGINFSGTDGLSTDTGKATTAIGDAAGGSGKEMRHRTTVDREMANATSRESRKSRQGSAGSQSSNHHHHSHHSHSQSHQNQLLLQQQQFLMKQHHHRSGVSIMGGSHASRSRKPYHPFADGAATAGASANDATTPIRPQAHDEMSVIFNRSENRHSRERDGSVPSASSSSSFFSSLLPNLPNLPMVPPLDFAMRFGGMPMQFNAAAAAAAAAAGLHPHHHHRNPSGGDERRSVGAGAASSRSGGSTPRPGPSSSSHQHPGDEERSSSNASDRLHCRDSPSSAASSSSAAAAAATGAPTASSSTTSTTTARSVASGFPFTTSISLIESHVGVGFTLGSREKPYKCEQCGQCYKYLSAFTKHKEQNHTARLPGEKPFRCEVCGMMFKYLKSFKKHRLNHAVERLHHVYPRSMPSAPRPPFPPPALVSSSAGPGGGGRPPTGLGLTGGIMEERSVLEMLARSDGSQSHHHRHREHRERYNQQQQMAEREDSPSAHNRRSEERSPSASVRIKTEIEVVSSGEEESNAAEDEKSLDESREHIKRSTTLYCPHCRSRFGNEDALRTHITTQCPERIHHLQQQQQQLQQQLHQHPGRMLIHPSLTRPAGASSANFPVGNPASNFLHGALQLQRHQQAAQATLMAVNYLAARAATASGNMPPPPGLERQVSDGHDHPTGRTTSHDGEAPSDREGSEDGDGSRSNSVRTSMGPSPASGAGPSAASAGPWHNLIRDFSAAAAAAAAAAASRPPVAPMPNSSTAAASVSGPPSLPSVAAAAAAAGTGGPPPEYDPGRPHLCPFCGKGFRAKENLKLHIRKHTGERPFECEFCGRAFGGKSDMNRHLRIHTGERPYRCDACGKTFARADYLSKHLSTHLV